MDNPLKIRRKRPRPGNVAALKRRLWWAILRVCELLEDEDTPPDQLLKAVHALSQSSAVYAGLLRESEMERRMAALEHRLGLGVRRHGHGVA